MVSVPGLNAPKVVRTRDIFRAEGHVSLPTQHVHSLAVSFIMGAARSGCDSRAQPCTMTLGGEVEQGRVNDAARVGRSTDLVVAPLFLLRFGLSSCFSCCFLSSRFLLFFRSYAFNIILLHFPTCI